MKPAVSDRFSLGVVFVAALGAAFGFGAWQGYHTPRDPALVDARARPAVVVQSGGVLAVPLASGPDTAGAIVQARPPAAPDAAASTL